MNTSMLIKQRGLGFSGFIFVVFVLVLVSIMGLKLIPSYIQDAKIKSIFVAIADDPEMQRATLRDIRNSFDKRSSVDDIKAIKAEDIKVDREGDRLVLSANYSVMIPVVGNVSLYLEFKPTSAK